MIVCECSVVWLIYKSCSVGYKDSVQNTNHGFSNASLYKMRPAQESGATEPSRNNWILTIL